MSKSKTDKQAAPVAAELPPVTPPEGAPPAPPAKAEGKARARDYADGYQPTGKVRVLAESASHQVLEDDVRRWKEPR